MKRALVAGGAGLIGSHLCERLLERGYEVIGVDNFLSSSRDNVAALIDRPGFTFLEHDVLAPLPETSLPKKAVQSRARDACTASKRRHVAPALGKSLVDRVQILLPPLKPSHFD